MPHRVLVGFSNGERKRLQNYLEEENVELDSFDLHGVLKAIKKHKVSVNSWKMILYYFQYYAEMDNYYIEHPRKNPVNMSIGKF